MFHDKHKLFVAIITLSVSIPSTGQAPLPLDPAVRTGKLPNGFTYYIRYNNTPKDRVIMYLANKVGSILETDEQQGLAHFVEHMSFNGTKHFPKNELVDYLEKSGVRFGSDLNAYTSFDETVYKLPLPSDKPEIIEHGIQIMRDWAQDATMDPEEIDKERGVVLEEKRLRKGAGERIQEQTTPLLLNYSRYASRNPIGKEEVIQNFKPEAIKTFYKDWYRPDLQALIVVGDIDVTEMEKSIREKFADLKNPTNKKPRTKYSVPLTGKNGFITVTDKELNYTDIQVMFKGRARVVRTAADYRASLVGMMFNQMLKARFAEMSNESDAPFRSADAGLGGLMADVDMYAVNVVAKPGELEKGFKAAWRMSRRTQLFGFTQTELDRARLTILNNMEASIKEKDKTQSGTYVNQCLQNFLTQTAAFSVDKENELVKRFIPGITLKDVNSVIDEYVKDSNRDIVIIAPEKDKADLPDKTTVLSWIKSVNKEKLKTYKDDVGSLPLLKANPAEGKIVKEEKIELGITRLVLSNGVNVLLKKTDFSNSQIVFSSFSRGGTSLSTDAGFPGAEIAGAVVGAGGVGNYTAVQLQKFLTGKQVRVIPYIGDREQGLNGVSGTEDLETALQLVYGYFTEPRVDKEIFKAMIIEARTAMANREVDPNTAYIDTINNVLGNYNIRRSPPSLEKIDRLNLDSILSFYKARFADASGLTFTFVGSIDEAKIKPLLEKYLGSLPAKGVKEKSRDLGIHIPPGRFSRTVYKGTAERATVMMVLSGPFDYSYENDVKMAALKGILQIRMTARLREQESGVYTPNVDLNTVKLPLGRFHMTISFACTPDNVDRLIAAAMDEVEKVVKNGPAQDDIDKHKEETRRVREIALSTNDQWLGYLNSQLINNEPLTTVDHYDEAMSKITVKGLKDLAAKYLTGENYISFILIPEKYAKNSGAGTSQ
ncbi:MAG: insulinase family protein [Chitinophagaceae bacterium]|nr:insulinase family protein [Chitinophagaceae bacterium]